MQYGAVLEVPVFDIWILCCQSKFYQDLLYFDEDRYSDMLVSFELMLLVVACCRNQFLDNLFEELD